MTGVKSVHEIVYSGDVIDDITEPDTAEYEIECPECQIFYPVNNWTGYDTCCDCCGGHPVLGCPNKEEYHFFDPYADNIDMKVRPIAGS